MPEGSLGDRPLKIAAVLSPVALFVLFSGIASGQSSPGGAAGQSVRPNIVVIVADDLGYGELGCQGHKDIPTPHIDSIAKNGVRFTSGYVSCPVCSPTRAGLMTGRYQQRFGHEFNLGPMDNASDTFGLVREEKTLAERLKAAGYATGMVGKWHLGTKSGLRPTERGFDEYFGFLGGAHPYLRERRRGNNQILRGTEPVSEPAYLTDAFGREAVAFIDHHKGAPFFLYLAFNAVHAPLQTTADYRKRFPSVKDEKRQTFSAMLSAMDDAVGKVLGTIHDSGLDAKTLVFFISDNGGPTPQTTSRNDPLRGTKTTTWEGGIRIPYMIQWKGHVPAGKVDVRTFRDDKGYVVDVVNADNGVEQPSAVLPKNGSHLEARATDVRGTSNVRPTPVQSRPAVTTLSSGRQAMNLSTSSLY